MRTLARNRLQLLSAAFFVFLPACTTHITEDLTASTTPHHGHASWFTNDGLVKHGLGADAFTNLNFENLKQDMALGRGEYLASLGTLMGIPENHQGDFFTLAQRQYSALAQANEATPTEFLTALDGTLIASGILTRSVGRE